MTISLKTQVPDVDTYLRLRVDSGLSGYGRDAAEIGLKNSLFCVMLYDGDEAIGMGRLIGDGGCFVQVTDIAVLPDTSELHCDALGETFPSNPEGLASGVRE